MGRAEIGATGSDVEIGWRQTAQLSPFSSISSEQVALRPCGRRANEARGAGDLVCSGSRLSRSLNQP
jgi:hypothetical protein